MHIRFSKTTGTFYPYSENYAPGSIPGDAIDVPIEAYHAAMARPTGHTFDFIDGELVIVAPPALTLDELKAAKNAEINAARLKANGTTFPHAGKVFACDSLSRSDIDGVANHIGLFGAFPPDFPGGWKSVDNTMLPMATIDDFKAFYQSMTAQGAANFNHSQALKSQLAEATTKEEVHAIVW